MLVISIDDMSEDEIIEKQLISNMTLEKQAKNDRLVSSSKKQARFLEDSDCAKKEKSELKESRESLFSSIEKHYELTKKETMKRY